MTENLLPAQFGNVVVIGKTGNGKTRIQADVMRTILNDVVQHPAAPYDDSDTSPKPDGDVHDEQ